MLLNSQIYKNYPEGKLKPHWVIIYSGMVQKVDIKLCGPESPDPPSGSPSGDRLRSREGVHLGWDSHIKMTVVSEILKRAQRGTKILFFRHGLNFFLPLEVPIILHSFFIQYAKRYCKAPALDLLNLKSPRGTKATLATPKRFDKHPCHFYMRVFPVSTSCAIPFIESDEG